MKKFFYIPALVILFLIFSCNSQSDAQKKAGEISKAINQSPEGEKTSADDSYLKATIDGKKWAATKTGPRYGPESNYKLVSGETKDITINFQLYKPYTGMKRQFGADYEANFITDDGFFSGKKGEVTVTRADEKWIEGTFYFTASSSSSDKIYEVTNGSFKIPVN